MKYLKISELSNEQKGCLVSRIDGQTGIGWITANRIAKGEFGDDDLFEVFKKCGCSEHSAKIQARKTVNLENGLKN